MMRETGRRSTASSTARRSSTPRSRSSTSIATEPTYLFLGTIDTHGAVDRAQAVDRHLLAAAVQRAVPGVRHREGARLQAGLDGLQRSSRRTRDIERLRAIYDSAISYQDKQLGRLVAQLKSWGIWDQTMLVDHRRSRRGAVRGRPLRPRRLAARLAGARAAARPRSGAVPRRHDRRRGRRGRRPPADDARRARRSAGRRRRAGRVARAARAGRRRGLAAAVVRVDVRVRARDADRALEDRVSARPARRSSAIWSPIRTRRRTSSRTQPVERRMLTDNLGLFLALRTQWKKARVGRGHRTSRAAGAAALDEATTP